MITSWMWKLQNFSFENYTVQRRRCLIVSDTLDLYIFQWIMGGFCCCLSTEDFEEYVYPNNPIYRQCISLRHFFHSIFGGVIWTSVHIFNYILGSNQLIQNVTCYIDWYVDFDTSDSMELLAVACWYDSGGDLDIHHYFFFLFKMVHFLFCQEVFCVLVGVLAFFIAWCYKLKSTIFLF